MKTALSFGLLIAASTLFACSEDEGEACRTNCGGSGNATANNGGSDSTGNGGTGNGGTSNAGSAGSAGTGSSGYTYGAPFVVGELNASAEAPVTEPGQGINGAAFIAQSDVMEVPAVHTSADGKLCMSGTTAAVVNMDYGSAWGAELIIDLLRPSDEPEGGGDAGASDAGGGDAGGGEVQPSTPWPMGTTLGFAYDIEGMNPDGTGAPELGLRFKVLPEGALGDNDTYCSARCPGTPDTCPLPSGSTNVLFSDITYECYNGAGGISLVEDMIPRRGAMVGGEAPLVANPRTLINISWQVNADPGITKPFNFCISNIRPILSAP